MQQKKQKTSEEDQEDEEEFTEEEYKVKESRKVIRTLFKVIIHFICFNFS